MAAKDITDKESLKRWLKGRPIEDARVIAARSALRAAPLLDEAANRLADDDWALRCVLASFRAYAFVWSAASYRTNDFKRVADDAIFMAAVSADEVMGLGVTDTEAATTAVTDAILAADGDRDVGEAMEYAADAAFFTWAAADGAIRSCVRDDALKLEGRASPAALAASPLWTDTDPAWVTTRWNLLKTELHARSIDHWEIWTDWYEARLRGEMGHKDEERARVLELTEEEWAAGPAVANMKIKGAIARIGNRQNRAPAIAQKASLTSYAFVSHASQNDGAYASTLTRNLEAAGIPCWIAPRDIPSGADWNGAIMNAIDACDAMILLVSDAALKSPFVKAEVQHAFERRKRVFPVRIADSAEAGQIDLRLKIIQHIDGRSESETVVAGILKSLR